MATATPRRAASTGAADRFAARIRANRRRRLASLVAGVVVLAVIAYLLLFSSWLRVHQIEVRGTDRASLSDIKALAEVERDQPLALVDVRSLAGSIATVPPVRTVDVSRHWPSTLRITVHERVPVAALPQGKRYQLVDAEGVVVESAAAGPASLPLLEVDLTSAGAEAMKSALSVQASLNPEISAAVRRLGATSPDGVWLVMSNGAKVTWGDASRPELKNDALRAVVTARPSAASYDVSAPGAPAVGSQTLSEPLSLTGERVSDAASATSSASVASSSGASRGSGTDSSAVRSGAGTASARSSTAGSIKASAQATP